MNFLENENRYNSYWIFISVTFWYRRSIKFIIEILEHLNGMHVVVCILRIEVRQQFMQEFSKVSNKAFWLRFMLVFSQANEMGWGEGDYLQNIFIDSTAKQRSQAVLYNILVVTFKTVRK